MKNQLLIPLIAIGLIGLIGTSSMISLVVIKQNNIKEMGTQFSDLSSEYEALLAEFVNITECYDSLIEEYQNLTENYEVTIAIYNILLANNSDLQEELDTLQATYDNLIINYNDLLDDYDLLLASFNNLQEDYNTLQDEFDGLQFDYNQLDDMYQNLNVAYQNLQDDYNSLQSDYNTLLSDYNILQNDFDALTVQYNDVSNTLNMFLDFIINELPMAQKMAFYYQFVRNAEPEWWSYDEMLEFGEKLILHSTNQYDTFSTVDSILNEYNFFDVNSRIDNNETISNVFGDFYPYWNSAASLQMIQDWITENLDYIYDSVTTWNRNYDNDFFQSPLETLMYRGGDCDDYAIVSCAMIEKQGWDTAMGGVFDPEHGLYGAFGHAFLFINVGESAYPSTVHWYLPGGPSGYPWIPVDTLWCDTIGDTPAWLQWYYDHGDTTWIADHIHYEINDGIF